jgi:hypothetical protein
MLIWLCVTGIRTSYSWGLWSYMIKDVLEWRIVCPYGMRHRVLWQIPKFRRSCCFHLQGKTMPSSWNLTLCSLIYGANVSEELVVSIFRVDNVVFCDVILIVWQMVQTFRKKQPPSSSGEINTLFWDVNIVVLWMVPMFRMNLLLPSSG